MPRFTHLHVHSEYSLLDGAMRVDRILEQTAKLGMGAVALTDHGNMCGAVEFYRKARKAGIKAIVGIESYIAAASRFDKSGKIGQDSAHLTLLASNEQGYRNLIVLSTLSQTEGYYYKPRIDRDLLKEHHDGLIVLSGCLKGDIAQLLLKGRDAQAEELASWYRDLLGPGNYYLEIMDHGIDEQKKINPKLVALSKKTGIPLVATNDAHYLRREDSEVHEVLLCIQTKTTMDNPDRMRLTGNNFYLKSPQEMAELFAEIPEAVTNSGIIADRCGLELKFADDAGGKPIFPPFPVPAEYGSADDYLAHLAEEGARMRYGTPSAEVRERMEHELRIIRELTFSTYFLIVWDIIKYSKGQGIMVGPGRGSAAGSLVSYLLGITDVDPLKYGLIFERFLNPGRHEPPDIDMDFRDDRRGRVVEYVRNKYGVANVAQIGTVSRMHSRAVMRDAGRAMGIPYGEVDKLAKLVPNLAKADGTKAELKDAMNVPEFKQALAGKPQYQRLFEVAISLEGLARHASTHAAGVVIVPGGLAKHVPLLRITGGTDRDEEIHVTQYDMNDLKNLGLVKMDLLGLSTLTVLDECRELVEETRGVKVDYLKIPLEDQKTYELFAEGRTEGIFQFESQGMKDNLRKLKPDRLEDLVVMNALYRPGSIDRIDEYIKRHRGEKWPAEDPKLEEVLKDTFGIIVYQEQVQRIAHVIGGFSMEKADDFRRSMGKKNKVIMDAQQAPFVEGAKKNGFTDGKAQEIFEFLRKFAGYGFNKSHSTAYALLGYWTAYMKSHFPVEFMAALLTSEMNRQDKISEYVGECRKMKVKILPPDVNSSGIYFTVEGKAGGGNGSGQAIRFGLAAVKNVGEGAVGSIVAQREKSGPFKSLFDFCERVEGQAVNKKFMESLIKCGAFDSIGGKREQLLLNLDQAMTRGARRQEQKRAGQEDLFGVGGSDDAFSGALPSVEETPERTRLSYEKELLGCYISGHPLAEFEDEIAQLGLDNLQPEILGSLPVSSPLRVAGVVTQLKEGQTKDKKKPFARFTIEDLEGSIECIAWQEVLGKCRECLKVGAVLLVNGTVDKQGDRPTLISREISKLEDAPAKMVKTVHLVVNAVGSDEALLGSVRQVSSMSPGDAGVIIHVRTMHSGTVILEAHPSMNVKPTRELLGQLKALLGEENVRMSPSKSMEIAPARNGQNAKVAV
jgi:DNA polymerase-3 subunit alpha